MKTALGLLWLGFCLPAAHADWEAVHDGLENLELRALVAYADTVMAGTADGIFRSQDGSSWTDISGNLAMRDVQGLWGGGAPRVLWVATFDGVYQTVNHDHYDNNTGSGLGTADAHYYWFGDTSEEATECAVGTNGAGLYVGADWGGPWTARNNGLTGDALVVNNMSGYSDDDFDGAYLCTEGGLFLSTDNLASWSSLNRNLSGDQLHVNAVLGFGTVEMIATDAGFLYSLEGADWAPLVEDDGVFNVFALYPMQGIGLAFGTNGYVTFDNFSYIPVDMGGVSGGLVTCATVTSTHIYVGTETGGVFRTPIDAVSVGEQAPRPEGFRLAQNTPNPFNPVTRIPYELAHPARIRLQVHDLLGRRVALLDQGLREGGRHQLNFDGSGLASGIYFYSLEVDHEIRATRRMLLSK